MEKNDKIHVELAYIFSLMKNIFSKTFTFRISFRFSASCRKSNLGNCKKLCFLPIRHDGLFTDFS